MGAVFGPVRSRRLGMSLGVDMVMPKTCTLDCIYCEAGPTTLQTTERGPYREPWDLLAQVDKRLAELDYSPDYITLAGSGEPTLNQDMGLVLSELRKKCGSSQLAVLTNGTLMTDPQVREELALADVVIPSLDAVTPQVFRKVNRPAPELDLPAIIEGIARFTAEFKGKVLLEILLVAGVNDSEEELAGLISQAERINPFLVQLNTVDRPPAVSWAAPMDSRRMHEIAARFKVPCETTAAAQARPGAADKGSLAEKLVTMTKIRPCTLPDLAALAGLTFWEAQQQVNQLVAEGKMKEEHFGPQNLLPRPITWIFRDAWVEQI